MARSKPKPAETEATPAEVDDGLTPVRTTFNPHEVIRVGDAELLDLKRQGLIYQGDDLAEPTEGEGEVVESGVITDARNESGKPDETEGGEGE